MKSPVQLDGAWVQDFNVQQIFERANLLVLKWSARLEKARIAKQTGEIHNRHCRPFYFNPGCSMKSPDQLDGACENDQE